LVPSSEGCNQLEGKVRYAVNGKQYVAEASRH
jgi:hypothetical protein